MTRRDHPNLRFSRLSPEVVSKHIQAFQRRFGLAHLQLAYHAALPLSLTPDLLYKLWANFNHDTDGTYLQIPWIAVADLLLSNLCRLVGYELYEMDPAIRRQLLLALETDPRFGPERIKDIGYFLLEYIKLPQFKSDDPYTRDFAQVQEWSALAYTYPQQAATKLAHAFAENPNDSTEHIRLASVVESLPQADPEFTKLLYYARGMTSLAYGDEEEAVLQFGDVYQSGEQKILVGGVGLLIPQPIIRELEVPRPSPAPGYQDSTTDNNPYKTRQLSPETLMAQEEPKKRIFRVKDTGDIIEPLIAHHLGRIEAKFSTRGATRLFLTGFGSFGGTSLVRATTARLLEAVKNNQGEEGEQVFVIRFDTSRRLHSGEYQLFVNEYLVGTLKEPVDQGALLAKINHALSQAAKSDNPQASNTLGQADFFAGMTTLFAQDAAPSQAIVDLVSQVLKLLESTHDDDLMHRALNDLLASSTQRRQMVLIIDYLEREEAMRRLLACPLCHQFSYPELSLVIVARHQAFMRWDERLRDQIREQRSLEYYYIRRLWVEDFDVRKMLSHFMDFDVSALNEQEQQQFDKLLAHLTYQARGSVARVIRELRKGPYLSKEGGTMAIHLDAIYQSGKESIEHNVRVQQLLDQNWDKILGQGMVSDNVEMADQARVGVYHVIEWIRRHPIFKIEGLVAAVRTTKIAISDQVDIFREVLIRLLIVLEKEAYLQYQPQTESYHLTWQRKPPSIITRIARRVLGWFTQGQNDSLSPQIVGAFSMASNRERTSGPTTSELRIALLGDGTDEAAQVVSLATQIAFEVIEAGHCLVMTNREGIERVVREKLASYWSLHVEDLPQQEEPLLLISTSNATRRNKCEVVIQTSGSQEQIKRLLEKADVIVLIQAHGATGSAFVPLLKMMAGQAGVPVIEPLADLEPAESFFVPDVARGVVELAQKVCGG